MKLSKFAYPLLMGLMLAVMSTGCRTNPQNVSTIYGRRPDRVDDMSNTRPLDPSIKGSEGLMSPGLYPLPENISFSNYVADSQIFASQTVHFDLDSTVVKASEKPKVSAVADQLKANQENAVRVEGHCDERGTEEYNRALGERRALALREELIRLGVNPNHVITLSYGEDRPADSAHDENAWSKNRRGEFVLLMPPK